MATIERLQAYLRHSAQQQYESVAVPPFTLFFHRHDPFPHFSYAIPDEPVAGNHGQALATLEASFRARGRQPRLEFLEQFAPALPALLRGAGFSEEARQPLMLCTPETVRVAPPVAGLTIVPLDPASPAAQIRGFLDAQRQGFSAGDVLPVTPDETESFRETLRHGVAFLGRLDGEPAGAAMFAAPWEGMVEMLGIATPERFRRRGIATALTARAVSSAFERGAQVAMLSAQDERAGRVYERIGFHPHSTMLAYSK